ncbi:hypothetical protein XENORESO_015398 [Xenotaenia resolanae]|uniref:Uncharacterized protein n=1 Tax=Xenotaenia resolanae TaxID=208358 RepID=A0ABV0WA48_9TELE
MTNKDNMDVDQKDSQSLPQDRSSFKDEESFAARKEWRVADVPVQEKAEKEQTEKKVKVMENEGSEMKMLLTHSMSDEARPHNDDTGQVGEMGPNFRNIVSSLSIDYKSSDAPNYGSGTRTNYSFGTEYNPKTQGSSGAVYTVVNAFSTLCPLSDSVSCRPVYSASQEETGRYNGGHGTMYSTVGTEGISLDNVSSSSGALSEKGTPELDLVLWSKLVSCVNKSAITTTPHIPVQAIDSVGSEGLGGDVDLQVRGLQTGQTHPHWLRELICNDGESNFNSGLTGQQHPKSLSGGKGKLSKKDSGTRMPPPIFDSLSIRSVQTHEHNSSVATITTSFQDSENSPLIDRRWAEVVPDWVVQHLAFLVKTTTQVVQD